MFRLSAGLVFWAQSVIELWAQQLQLPQVQIQGALLFMVSVFKLKYGKTFYFKFFSSMVSMLIRQFVTGKKGPLQVTTFWLPSNAKYSIMEVSYLLGRNLWKVHVGLGNMAKKVTTIYLFIFFISRFHLIFL